MKFKIYFYYIQSEGIEEVVIASDPSDTVSIDSLLDHNGDFCAEAYHLEDWAKERGFEFKQVVKEFDSKEIFK